MMKRRLATLAAYPVAILLTLIPVDSVFGQAISRSRAVGRASGGGSSQGQGYGQTPFGNFNPGVGARSSSNISFSRSMSFTENGRRVSIKENQSGITVTVDGQTVRAANAAELKKTHPEAYLLYGRLNDATQASARASGSAGAGQGSRSSNQRSRSSSVSNRNVSVLDNGRKISITENKRGIVVSVDGRVVRARNAAALKKRNPEAYELYKKHLEASPVQPTMTEGSKPGSTLSANELMRRELRTLRDRNGDNPRIQQMIDKLMQTINEQEQQ